MIVLTLSAKLDARLVLDLLVCWLVDRIAEPFGIWPKSIVGNSVSFVSGTNFFLTTCREIKSRIRSLPNEYIRKTRKKGT